MTLEDSIRHPGTSARRSTEARSVAEAQNLTNAG